METTSVEEEAAHLGQLADQAFDKLKFSIKIKNILRQAADSEKAGRTKEGICGKLDEVVHDALQARVTDVTFDGNGYRTVDEAAKVAHATDIMRTEAQEARKLYQQISEKIDVLRGRSAYYGVDQKERLTGYWEEALIGEAASFIICVTLLPSMVGRESLKLPHEIRTKADMYRLIDRYTGVNKGYEHLRGMMLQISSAGLLDLSIDAIAHLREKYSKIK